MNFQKLAYVGAPLLWDRDAVAIGLTEVENCRLIVLAWLKELLDSYHGTSRSLAYYDLLAGDWLLYFTHLVYAAWREVLAEYISTENQVIPVSADLTAYNQMCWQASGLHEHLRWAVARLLEGASPHDWRFECESVLITSGGRRRLPQRLLRGLATAKPDILVIAPYFKCSRSEWAGALFRWRHHLAWNDLQYPIHVSARLDTTWRKSQAVTMVPATNLSELLQILLPLHLPVALLEGFLDYRKAALALPVERPKTIYSANALLGHLTFKLLAAEWRQQGTLLLYHQHGGGYGIDRVHAVEEFETRVTDRYYTWGWQRKESHVKPLSAPPVQGPCRPRKWLLLSCVDFPRVVYRLHFHPMPGTIQTMHRETCKFLAALPDRSKLLVRPYPQDYGWGFIGMMRKSAPDAKFDEHRVGAFVRYAESRLVIHNYLGTGWLETLALNIPTVCFYDPATYAFREVTQPFIDKLEMAGILHRSGVTAARFVAGILNNTEIWWNQPDIQAVRQDFIDHYANFSPDWKQQWEREFEAVLDGVR